MLALVLSLVRPSVTRSAVRGSAAVVRPCSTAHTTRHCASQHRTPSVTSHDSTVRMPTLDDVLYPALEPSRTGKLAVSDLHTIFWEVSPLYTIMMGNCTELWRQVAGQGDLPVVVLHGGPGGGCQPEYRRYKLNYCHLMLCS